MKFLLGYKEFYVKFKKDHASLIAVLSLLNSTKLLTHRKYGQNVQASGLNIADELLFPHVQAVLKWAEEARLLDLNSNLLQAELCNTWGRYFQMHDQFKAALRFYERGLNILDAAEKLSSQMKADKTKVIKYTALRIDTSHNYGSTCLRIWHQVGHAERDYAKKCLESALANYRQPTVFGPLEKFPKDPQAVDPDLEGHDYEDLHFRFFTYRAYARLLKAEDKLSKALDIFEKIYARVEYRNWPKGGAVSETEPLAKMDLGVTIYRIEDKRMRRFQQTYDRSLAQSDPSVPISGRVEGSILVKPNKRSPFLNLPKNNLPSQLFPLKSF